MSQIVKKNKSKPKNQINGITYPDFCYCASPGKIFCSVCACCSINPKFVADYIIIGMGAAGSVLGARLAEDLNTTVLFLETGPDNSPEALNKTTPNSGAVIDVPALGPLLFDNPLGPNPSPSDLKFVTTSQLGTTYKYIRGTGVGGSTNHHGMVDGRGSRVFYDNIAKQTNAQHWSYGALLPIFKNMESYDVNNADLQYHGKKGWMHVKQPKMEPNFSNNLINACVDNGIPFRTDMQGDPKNAFGVGLADIQVKPNGKRAYAAHDLLFPMQKKQTNIRFAFNTLVNKILFSNDQSEINAKGVLAFQGKRLYKVDDAHEDGSSFEKVCYFANKEIILCGGAIDSPKILLLSGIGETGQLAKLKIPTVVNNRYVGANLMDHTEVGLVHEMDANKNIWRYQATLTQQNIEITISTILDTPVNERTAEQKKLLIKLQKLFPHVKKFSDPTSLTEPGFDVMIDCYSTKAAELSDNKNIPRPDIHILSALFYFKNFDIPAAIKYINNQFVPSTPDFLKVYHTFIVENLVPTLFNGTIKLQSTDPTLPPLIDLRLWEDDAGIERCARGIQIARQIVQNKHVRHLFKQEVLPGKNIKTLAQLKDYIKKNSAFGHHMSGTCAMTKVVDSNLKVMGVNNLRVCDLSVLPPPNLVGYNPSRATYVIGEVLAKLIKQS